MAIEVKRVDDAMVIDSKDVERAQKLAMRREDEGVKDGREEKVVRISPDETLVLPPEK